MRFWPSAGPALAQGKVLKFVQNGNLTILDPIWTTAYVTRNHGYFIYDTLFASDENNAVKPQMVDKYEVSADKTVWTFTLRDGLEWHDGKPVTSEDCIASIKRWGARDAMGQKLMDFVKEFKEVDAKTFQMVLKEPYGLVLDSLGKPSSQVPFMMPKQVAETDPFKQIDSQIGSGPFIYVNAESKPGEKHVYLKNPKYKPRTEPRLGPGRRQGRQGRPRRDHRDARPAAAGERARRRRDRRHRAAAARPDPDPEEGKGRHAVRLEPARPPVHHPLQQAPAAVQQSRRSARPRCYSMRQEDYLKATVGEPEFYKVCSAAFICGTPNAVDAPNGLLVKPNFEKSKALLKEAGYDGTPIVLMQSTTLPVLTNMAPVTKALLEQGGFKVDMQSMDWQTLVTRRTKKDPAEPGRLERVPHLLGGRRHPEPDLRPPTWWRTATRRGSAGRPIRRWRSCATPTPRKPTRPRARRWPRPSRPARSRPAQYGWIGQWYGPGAMRANITRLAEGAGAGDVEHREEVTARLTCVRAVILSGARGLARGDT